MILKKGDKLGQVAGALKKGGWNPLTNYVRDVGFLNEDDGLTVKGWGGRNCIKYFKRQWNEKTG